MGYFDLPYHLMIILVLIAKFSGVLVKGTSAVNAAEDKVPPHPSSLYGRENAGRGPDDGLATPAIAAGSGMRVLAGAAAGGRVEASLHSEAVIHRYRAVFALGRAYDKLHFAERHPPRILFVGNSRADNGIDPRTVSRAWPDAHQNGFNLGVPGANAIVYHGMVKRLDAHGLLGGKTIHSVVLVLDENTFQEDNSLGYLGFLADRRALFEAGRYQDWLGQLPAAVVVQRQPAATARTGKSVALHQGPACSRSIR